MKSWSAQYSLGSFEPCVDRKWADGPLKSDRPLHHRVELVHGPVPPGARLLGEDQVQVGMTLEHAAEDQVVHGDAGRLADEVEVADDRRCPGRPLSISWDGPVGMPWAWVLSGMTRSSHDRPERLPGRDRCTAGCPAWTRGKLTPRSPASAAHSSSFTAASMSHIGRWQSPARRSGSTEQKSASHWL